VEVADEIDYGDGRGGFVKREATTLDHGEGLRRKVTQKKSG